MADALFKAASATLKELLFDARYLGAQAAMLLALPASWGRALSLHPHLHALVSEGGVSNGEWVCCLSHYFVIHRHVCAGVFHREVA